MSIKIIPLSEGAFTIDATKEFVPFNLAADDLYNRPKGSLLVEIQPFLIQMSNRFILIDTGLGFVYDGVPQIHENLRKYGITPGQISMVLLSHLHKDHAGGISFFQNGKQVLTFPNAHYFVHKKEWDYAIEKGSPSYDVSAFTALENSSQLHLFNGIEGEIAPGIFFEQCGGHCPYHLSFSIIENQKHYFFGGDVAPQLQQMKRKFIAKYDFDGKRCLELREEWLQKGKIENWTFMFYHDIKTPLHQF